jgi:excisionase family DNA binding protein
MHAKHLPTGAPTPAPAHSGLATQAEACAFLKVSRQYLWLQTRKGRINSVRFGRLVRYSWAELEKIAGEGLPPAVGIAAGGAK